MFSFFGLIALGCLIGAYFSKGINRWMFGLMAVAILYGKMLIVNMKFFTILILIIAGMYFLGRMKKNTNKK